MSSKVIRVAEARAKEWTTLGFLCVLIGQSGKVEAADCNQLPSPGNYWQRLQHCEEFVPPEIYIQTCSFNGNRRQRWQLLSGSAATRCAEVPETGSVKENQVFCLW